MNLIPAYGRDYKNKRSLISDFDNNKDFIVTDVGSVWDGKLVNKSQLLENKIIFVCIRYAKLAKIALIKL